MVIKTDGKPTIATPGIEAAEKLANRINELTDLSNRFERIDPYIIGLWRFRVAGQPRQWCVTYAFRGRYYDTLPQKSREAALDDALQSIDKLRETHGECPLATLPEDRGLTLEQLESLKETDYDSPAR